MALRKFRLRASGEEIEWAIVPPTLAPDGQATCSYRVLHGHSTRTVSVSGCDSLQALLLALHVGASDVDALLRRAGGCDEADDWTDLERITLGLDQRS